MENIKKNTKTESEEIIWSNIKLQLKEKLSELDTIKESRLDDEAQKIRHETIALEQARQMRLLQDTVNELKNEIRAVKNTEKKP